MSGRPVWDPATPYVPGRGFAPQGTPAPSVPPGPPGRPNGGRTGWVVLGLVTMVLVVALVAWAVTRAVDPSPVRPGGATSAGTVPSTKSCPTYPRASASPGVGADGRVHGGELSYPLLPAPWSAPQAIWRTPFTVDSTWQWIATESDASGAPRWVSSVEVGELTSGDGMPHPADAHELVLDCIMGTYETAVERTYVASRATKIGGHDAWFDEVHLTFDKPGIKVKGETVLLVVVRTSADRTSLFFASIPDGNPDHLADARRALAGLRVG